MMLDEGNMEGREDSGRGGIPQTISLGMWSITNQDTRGRAGVEFGWRRHDKGECPTPNLVQVREARLAPIPKLKRSLATIGSSGSECGEVGGSGSKLIPEIQGCITREAHHPGFREDRPMETFHPSVLC